MTRDKHSIPTILVVQYKVILFGSDGLNRCCRMALCVRSIFEVLFCSLQVKAYIKYFQLLFRFACKEHPLEIKQCFQCVFMFQKTFVNTLCMYIGTQAQPYLFVT